MPKFSAFTPFGQLRMSSLPSLVEVFYRLLPKLWGSQLDFSEVGSYNEQKLYASARMAALMAIELEHAGNQANPLKAWDLIPLLEQDFMLTPGAKDTIPMRQRAIAAAQMLPQGATASNVVNSLKTLIGSSLLSYVPNPAGTPTVYPTSPGSGPGAFKDVRIPAKFLQLVDPVLVTGSPLWCSYQALDTTSLPELVWTANSTYSVGQQILPTAIAANGYVFECTVAGATSTIQPSWPNAIGDTVVDGGVTWTCVAPIAPALYPGDVVVVDAGNTSQMEPVTVTAVSNTPQGGATAGYLYFEATFTKSHDIAAPMTTGSVPYWWSTQRLNYVVVGNGLASDLPTRTRIHALLAKLLRGVSQWAIVAPSSTTFTGGAVGPLMYNTPIGTSPIGSLAYKNSN